MNIIKIDSDLKESIKSLLNEEEAFNIMPPNTFKTTVDHFSDTCDLFRNLFDRSERKIITMAIDPEPGVPKFYEYIIRDAPERNLVCAAPKTIQWLLRGVKPKRKRFKDRVTYMCTANMSRSYNRALYDFMRYSQMDGQLHGAAHGMKIKYDNIYLLDCEQITPANKKIIDSILELNEIPFPLRLYIGDKTKIADNPQINYLFY